jgi:hypothetical protein
VWTNIQSHFDQFIPAYLPLAVLAVDVFFKVMLGNWHLHPFGGDMALCGFVVYLGTVIHLIQVGSALQGPALISSIFGIIGALLVWFITLFLGSLEVWGWSLLAAFIGLYTSSLCAESAWSMLSR